jgi:hypothetical protein
MKKEHLKILTSDVKWKKIDPNNLPKKDVLALNDGNAIMVGKLELFSTEIDVFCHLVTFSGCVIINNFTHYISLKDLLNLEKEK